MRSPAQSRILARFHPAFSARAPRRRSTSANGFESRRARPGSWWSHRHSAYKSAGCAARRPIHPCLPRAIPGGTSECSNCAAAAAAKLAPGTWLQFARRSGSSAMKCPASSIQSPGAEPRGFSSTSAPSGTIACRAFTAGISGQAAGSALRCSGEFHY